MSWPKATGSFTKQVIEKWKFAKREKREAVSACMIAGNCEEDVIPIEQTSHTTDIDPNKEYKFILAMYDGEVNVAQFEPDDVITKGEKGKFFHHFLHNILLNPENAKCKCLSRIDMNLSLISLSNTQQLRTICEQRQQLKLIEDC